MTSWLGRGSVFLAIYCLLSHSPSFCACSMPLTVSLPNTPSSASRGSSVFSVRSTGASWCSRFSWAFVGSSSDHAKASRTASSDSGSNKLCEADRSPCRKHTMDLVTWCDAGGAGMSLYTRYALSDNVAPFARRRARRRVAPSRGSRPSARTLSACFRTTLRAKYLRFLFTPPRHALRAWAGPVVVVP